ncbi:MAG: heat-inducible transcriptional repressor [Myxococcota bacterium]
MREPSNSIGDERSRAVLRAAVETYIHSSAPVASKALNRTGLPLSSAAIRAVMAGLEESGLLVKPHTSAGRVPTQRGYRAYVDRLMAVADVSDERRDRVQRILSYESETHRLMTSCVNAVVQATGLPGFAVSAPQQQERHRHVELVRLRPGEVLAIFASRSGRVVHRHVRLKLDISQGELDRFQNFLNARFDGMTFEQMRALVDRELKDAEERYRALSTRAFELTSAALPDDTDGPIDFVVSGHHHLLSQPEFADAAIAGPVLEELERRKTWKHMLDVALSEQGIVVMIGSENDVEGLRDCAVVATALPWGHGVDGTLGIIGPTRLAYGAAISLIDYVRQNVLSHWMRRRYPA